MKRLVLAFLIMAATTAVATAQTFAVITRVDAEKGTVDYTITRGVKKDNDLTAKVTKDCIIRNGEYVLGKPAKTVERAEIAEGLKNAVFQKVADKPLQVHLFFADQDDAAKRIKQGEVVKILVNKMPKK